MKKQILGISAYYHDSAAALVVDGEEDGSFRLNMDYFNYSVGQGKRTLFLECLLDKGSVHYLVWLINPGHLAQQPVQDLGAFALLLLAIPAVPKCNRS